MSYILKTMLLNIIQIIAKDPSLVVAKISQLFLKEEPSFKGQSPLAFIHQDAQVHKSVTLYPFAFIGARSQIEEGCVIYPHTFIGEDVKIGKNTFIYPGVTILKKTMIGNDVIIHPNAVIGSDGFGFVATKEEIIKVPQKGKLSESESN